MVEQKVRGPILSEQDAGAEAVQKILKAAAPSETERFQLPITMVKLSDPALATDLVDTGPLPQKVSYYASATNVCTLPPALGLHDRPEFLQRKHETLKMDSKTAAAVDEKEVLWRVNYEECLRRLRHQVHTCFILPLSQGICHRV